MRLFRRLVIMAALSAPVCAGCDGTPEASPDSGTPGADAAVPDSPAGWPQFTVSPASIDFGCVDVGVTSHPVVVTVTNVGTATSGPLSVIISGTGIMTSGCDGVVIAPKESCQISVVSKLAALGPLSGTIEVGDIPVNTKKIAVSGICIGMHSGFLLSQAPLDLGSVPMGKTVTGTIVLTSTATRELTGIVINISGAGFSLSPSGTCTDTLPAYQSCNIDVSFTAGITGPAKGTLSVSQGGVTKPVALTAMVEQPAPLPTPWDQARIANTGTSWWMNVVKGKFFLSIKLKDSAVDDSAGRAEVVGIAKVLAGKSGSTALDLIPKPTELPGTWIYNPSFGETEAGPVVATTFEQATNYIDGGAEPFYNSGVSAKTLVWGNYMESDPSKDPPHSLDVRIWEMASASDASTLYTSLLQNALYSPDNIPWSTCQGGDATNPCP